MKKEKGGEQSRKTQEDMEMTSTPSFTVKKKKKIKLSSDITIHLTII